MGIFWVFYNYFIVVQLQLSAFSLNHYAPPPAIPTFPPRFHPLPGFAKYLYLHL